MTEGPRFQPRALLAALEEANVQLDGRALAAGSAWKFLTDYGELHIALDPDGTQGYPDLIRSAATIEVYGMTVRVASLADVIRSKEAADRPRDRAVLPDLRRTLELASEREADVK